MTDALKAGPWTRRSFLRVLGTSTAGALVPASALAAQQAKQAPAPQWGFQQSNEALDLKIGDRLVLRYNLRKPPSGGSASESACYVHPLTTPTGTIVTDCGPRDHPHHRGLFLGWVEMHGKKDADFWGWGEAAPIKNRRIINQSVETRPPALGSCRFRVVNDWMADDTRVLREDLRVTTSFQQGATMLDMAMQLAPDAELTLARWAFGGFALRTRTDGEGVPVGPDGVVRLNPPKHTDPTSNWPDVGWYGLSWKLRDGKQFTVAIASRSTNPVTTWHVVPAIGLLNPSITAPAAVQVAPDKPLVLRYRVIAFDGPPALDRLNKLGEGWHNGTG